MDKKIYNIVRSVLSENSNKMCSECGSRMVEGECSECGYMKEEIPMEENLFGKLFNRKDKKFDALVQEADKLYEETGECQYVMDGNYGSYVTNNNSGKGSEPLYSTCDDLEDMKDQFSDIVDESKKLSKGQKHIAKQAKPYDKIGANDFAKLRSKKSETNENEECYECGKSDVMYELEYEVEESPEFNYAAMKAKEEGKKSFKLGGKTFPVEEDVYELNMNESTGEKIKLKESEIIDIIENIIIEEKKKKTKVNNVTKDSQSKSKKENDDYISSVVKKMKDYLKGGSKGEFEMSPKHFPKGNGELGEMGKKAYKASNAVEEYVENFTAAALENIVYDDIKPNEEWVEDNLVGSSRTGNNPKWANAVETEVGERRNKIRKDNLLGQIKKKAYNKSPQPVTDEAGENADKASKLLMKLESKESKNVLNEINQMKSLINYNKKSQ
jgi:hypothetical protein